MNSLSKSEEQLMKHLWELDRCYLKELMESLPEPRPAKTTVATLLRRMIDKKMVAFRTHGSNRQYYPLVSKEAYFGPQVRGMISDFFSGSPTQFASFFTAQADLSKGELEALRRMIDDQLNEDEA